MSYLFDYPIPCARLFNIRMVVGTMEVQVGVQTAVSLQSQWMTISTIDGARQETFQAKSIRET